jgi:AraC-like DNA-binding protein
MHDMRLQLLDSTIAAARTPYARGQVAHLQAGESFGAAGAERMRFWRPFRRKALDVVLGEGTARDVPLHSHEALQVLLPTSRFAVVDGAGRATTVYPGVILLTSPGELQGARGLDGAPIGMRVMLVFPRPATTLGADASGGRREEPARFAQRVVRDPGLDAELRSLFDALRRPVVALECESRLADCVDRLLARCAEAGPERPEFAGRSGTGLARVRDYLRAHVTDDVALDDLAGLAGLSPFYLLRAFRRAYGLTPHAYQMQLRLARARHLMVEGRPLSHVTYDAGFADQSHLTRRFKAYFGFTPAQYSRQFATPPGAAPRVEPRARWAAAPRPAA